jgi:hypothetical protein
VAKASRRLLTAFHRAKSTPPPGTEAGAASQVEKTQEVHGPTRKKWGKQPYRSFLCFDVEATCSGGKDFHYPNEIIVSVQDTSTHRLSPHGRQRASCAAQSSPVSVKHAGRGNPMLWFRGQAQYFPL